MRRIFSIFSSGLLLTLCLLCTNVGANESIRVPILAYHNFDPTATGSMTISTKTFETQLKWLADNGYTVIPLQDLVSYLHGKKSSLPEKSVVITADDGRKSVYDYMLPLVKKYNVPVTLFVYPMIISKVNYAMTWEELKELQATGLFDIQGHTYWHPNFKQEKKRLSEKEYEKLVKVQLVNSKQVINEKLATNITLLAWPFGIYNEHLEQAASNAGYEMAFSIDALAADKSHRSMSQPRYMIVEGQTMKTFAAIASGKPFGKRH